MPSPPSRFLIEATAADAVPRGSPSLSPRLRTRTRSRSRWPMLVAVAVVVLAGTAAPTAAQVTVSRDTASSADSSVAAGSECELGAAVTLAESQGIAVVTDSECVPTSLEVETLATTNRTIVASSLGIQQVTSIPDADTLDLTQNSVTYMADLSVWAPSLKKIILKSNSLTSLKGIELPASLEALDLSSNRLPSLSGLDKFSLKALELMNASISDLSKIALPTTLRDLNVAFNTITKLPQLASLSALTSLTLTGNGITSFKDMAFPAALTSLDLSWNKLSSFAGFGLPTTVTKLYLGGNYFTSLAELNLASNLLTVLYLHDLPLQSIDGAKFPDTVTALSLMNCSLTSLGAIKLPSSLIYLDVSGNALTAVPSDLPESTRGLTLSNNKLTELRKVKFPKGITKLDFEGNEITRVVGTAFPWSLETLSFGATPVAEFEISRSDYNMIQKLKVFNATIEQTSCANAAAEKVVFARSTFCVLADDVFVAQYGSSATDSVDSNATSDKSGGAGWVLPVVLCAAALGAVVAGVFVYRARKNKSVEKSSRSEYPQTLADPTVFNSLPNNNNPYNFSNSNLNPNNTTMMSSGTMSSYHTMFSNSQNGGQNGSSSSQSGSKENSLVKYRIPTHEITVQKALAHGGFGVVYLATYQMQDVVVKKILPEKASDDRCLEAFLDEIKLCSTLNHPKIVRFVGVSWNTLSDIAVVLEYMANGDLDTLLKQQFVRKQAHPNEFGWYKSVSLPCKAALALDVLDAIVYLHSFSSPIIHRDLKAKNVLLGQNYEAKLSDFGVSKEWRVDATMTAGIGTMAWIAPEVLRGERYTEKADIYSFGVILTELATCAKPFEGITNALIVLKVTSGEQRPEMGTECPEDIRELGLRCLSYDPSDRPSAMVAHYELKTLLKAHTAFEL